MGIEPTGRRYRSMLDPRRVETAMAYLHATARHPCGMIVLIEWRYEDGRIVQAVSVGFPLAGHRRVNILFMVFCDNELPSASIEPTVHRDDDTFSGVTVADRKFIDIGFGVPEMSTDEPAGI